MTCVHWIRWSFYVMLIILISEMCTCTYAYAFSKRTHHQTLMNWTWWCPLLQFEPTERNYHQDFQLQECGNGWRGGGPCWNSLFSSFTPQLKGTGSCTCIYIFSAFTSSTLWTKAAGQLKWHFYAPEIEDRGAYCFCPVCHSVIL